MLLAVAALAYNLFCHKLISVTFYFNGVIKVGVSSFSSPNTQDSFKSIALLWINVAVANGKYLKTSPVPLLDLHSIILLKIDKSVGGRVIQHKEVSATRISI